MRDPTQGIVTNIFTIQRLGTGISTEARELLQALFDDIVAQIARIDPTSPTRRTFRVRRLEKLIGEVETLLGKRIPDIRRMIRSRLVDVGGQQAGWATTQLEATIGVVGIIGDVRVPPSFFRHIIDSDPFDGLKLRGWFDSLEDAAKRRVRRQLQLGLAQNETIGDMIRRVRGRRAGRGFTGGVLQTTTRDAETIVRTGVNYIASRSHLETYQQNADVVTKVEYTATLDSRTSDICISLDGRQWEPDDPDIRIPPQHPRCRSVLLPVVDWKGLGLPEPPEGTKASADGPVAASTRYSDWLRRQSKATQNDILGPARAQLFRDGKLSLRDLVRTDGRSVTVRELEERAAA